MVREGGALPHAKSTRTEVDASTKNPHERPEPQCGRRSEKTGVIMADRRTLRRIAQRYRRATKKQKARILDEFVETHECTRNHASWLLRSWGKTVFSHQGGQLVKIVVGQRRARCTVPRVYDQQVYEALEKIWYLHGGMCGKRLIGVLRHQLPLLEKFGEITVDAAVREKLQHISAATIDRLLQAEKRKLQVRRRSHTKPTTRLLHRVPIRTFAEWQDATVGEMGADLGRPRWRRRWRRACLHAGAHRPRHAVDRATRGAEQGPEMGVSGTSFWCARGCRSRW